MLYRQLGNTNISLSLIGLGTMTWGEQNTQAEAFAQMDMAMEHGINFIDVAEMYPVPPKPETYGETEKIVGAWLSQRQCRDKIVLATKVTGRGSRNSNVGHIRNGPRLSKNHIHNALDASLKRLKTDYIDLYQVHWPERSTNFFGKLGYRHEQDDGVEIEETLAGLTELVSAGKIRHIGISNETAWGVLAYKSLAREKQLSQIVSIQNPYNLLNRTYEIGGAEISIREQVSFLAYSPLAFGKLSGKYRGGAKPEGARLTRYSRFKRYDKINCDEAINAYLTLAEQYQLDPSQMALAYVNSRDFMTSNIIGATNLSQLQTNIDSINLTLSDEVLEGIEAIHARYPNPAP